MFPIRDHNPSNRIPYVCYALIAANIAVFLLTYGIQDNWALSQLYFDYALIPRRLNDGDNPQALITSMFLHAGFMHLAGNMLFLWIYGDNMEDELGHFGFLAFYLTAGIGAGLAQYAASPTSPVPMVGASGAIAGVMGGYLLLFPKAKIDVLVIFIIIFKIFPIPAWIVLGVWFGLQLLNGLGSDVAGGGVAYMAHLGGFIAGLILTIPIWMRRGGSDFWRDTDGHPPHPEAQYKHLRTSNIPRVPRK
ncbi:rhomboid family intramembrane serine protease [Aestuariibius sp. HNIBRBA575]|uniref:rhomboid family intramembrane serine protease n=1 Tax=Aestuariibius sp. HNIBRBA575 TaxID=3233343 RepID=UPI0034A5CBF5